MPCLTYGFKLFSLFSVFHFKVGKVNCCYSFMSFGYTITLIGIPYEALEPSSFWLKVNVIWKDEWLAIGLEKNTLLNISSSKGLYSLSWILSYDQTISLCFCNLVFAFTYLKHLLPEINASFTVLINAIQILWNDLLSKCLIF